MKTAIQILTPVHVGSGKEIQSGYEYAYFPKENKVAFLDPEKVLMLIGEDQINAWISCIEKKQSLLDLPQLRSRTLTSSDVAIRSLISHGACSKPIREHLRTGSDFALLPGSSLKGALRTVVFGETILDNPKLAKEKRNLGMVDYRGGFRWTDAQLQKTLFGSDPNHDIFRLLQVGDAHFDRTEVFQTQIVNLKGKEWIIDKGNKADGISAEAWVEALPPGLVATTEIRFNETLNSRAEKLKTFSSDTSKLRLPELFKLVNAFTGRLLNDEITYWTTKADPPEGFDDYIPELEHLLDVTDKTAENECVIRLGWGSGFRSMTGDWHSEMHDDDFYALVNSLRSRKYEGLLFPKTVRFSGEGVPLGFVKLSILS